MKKTLTILFLFVTIVGLTAQSQPRIEDMHARKWEFISSKMQFNAQQTAKVKVIFMDYETSVWKIMEKSRTAHRSFLQDNSKADYEKMNDGYVDLEIQKAQLLKNYYTKLKKYLTAEEIYKYFDVERSFKRELMREWQGKGRQQHR